MKSREQIAKEIDIILTELETSLDKKLKSKLVLMIERVLDNDQQDNYLIIEGDTGCLAGDSIIRYNRGKNARKITIKKLYNSYHNPPMNKNKKVFDTSIPTYIRAFNGKEIRLHKLRNVLYSGKKKVFKLILEDGKTIKATDNHKFLTLTDWKELKDLNIGDILLCDSPKAEKNGRKRIKLRDIGLCVGNNHPYNIQPNKQIPVHTLIYEARMNNLEFLEYLDILLNEPEISKTLKYINPKTHSIHHKDGCHYNNSIENLQLMLKEEHSKLHADVDENYRNFSQGIPKHIKIKEIIEEGIEDTYDIECEEPYHNFVANDIIVHNSGKTNLSVLISHIVSRITDREFNEDNIYFDVGKATDFAKTTKKQIIIFDEPAFGGLKREWQGKVQLNLIKLLFTSRKLRHFVILNLVKFNRFSEDIVERAIAMIRVYKRDNSQKQRRFLYFKQMNLIALNEAWKQKHKRLYNKFASFHGTLGGYVMPLIIDVDKYEDMKDDAIANIGVDKKKDGEINKEALLQVKILNGFKRMKDKGIVIKFDEYCKAMDISDGTPTNWKRNLEKLGIVEKKPVPTLELAPVN